MANSLTTNPLYFDTGSLAAAQITRNIYPTAMQIRNTSAGAVTFDLYNRDAVLVGKYYLATNTTLDIGAGGKMQGIWVLTRAANGINTTVTLTVWER